MLIKLNLNQSLTFLFLISASLLPLNVRSQVIPDNTTNTQINQNGNITEITGGETRGENLFQSFQELSIETGTEAFFNNAINISNIFSRVTGGNISNIDGLIRANGNANLFLINPAGIVFGENARLDIGGSFLGTTAETINFSDVQFSAVTPEKPILTNTIPIGLGFGSNSGDITIQGQQNNVVIEIPSFRIFTEDLPQSIQVNPGKNISLLGGNINLVGGGLQAPGGDIELVSINGNESVNLVSVDEWFDAGFNDLIQFEDIIFSNAAYIDVSSEVAGNIDISGRQIIVDQGSAILANSFLSTDNNININASETIEIKGSSGKFNADKSFNEIEQITSGNLPGEKINNNYSISIIGADIFSDTNGNGNNINVNTTNLRIFDAGQIRTINFSKAKSFAGDININAKNILVQGTNNIDSLISSTITGGNINILTQLLQVKDGGRIQVDSFNSGTSGNLLIESEDILLEGYPKPLLPRYTGLFTNSSTNDNQESISIKTRTLNIFDGAKISSNSVLNNPAGQITIEAESITVSGFIPFGRFIPSAITSSVNVKGASQNIDQIIQANPIPSEAGTVNIETTKLRVLDGARIESVNNLGNSGSINIKADNIELNGTRPKVFSFIGGISTSTRGTSFGRGGNINIDADSLTVANGSIIRAISLGSGDAGNIDIDAQKIKVFGFDRFAPEPISPQRISKINTGALRANGGNIDINSDSIELDNLGGIQASTLGEGLGGNIFLKTDEISLQNQANIAANAMTGNGGNINLDVANLQLDSGSEITATAGNDGNGGNITINANTVLAKKNSEITANAFRGNGGNIQIDTQGFFLFPDSSVTASSEFGVDGTVEINSLDRNLQKDLELDNLNLVTTKEILEGSCLAPRKPRASFKLVSTTHAITSESLPVFFDSGSITGFDHSFEPLHTEQLPDIPSQPIESLIPANQAVKTKDGRIFLVATPLSPDSLLCKL